jgi:hypothetical protein
MTVTDSGVTCGTHLPGGGEAFGSCSKGETCCPGGAAETYNCTVVTDAGCPKVP